MCAYDCENPRPLPPCDPAPEPVTPEPCPEWEICLPFGSKLYTADGCIRFQRGTPPPDGIYSRVVVVDGCIVGLEKEGVPMYSSAACAPVPCSCEDSSGGGAGSLPDPSQQAGNLFGYDAFGRPLVRVYAQAKDGSIAITGTGTAADPLIFSVVDTGGSGIFIESGNDAISVTGSGSREDPWLFVHKTGKEGTFNGLKFDRYGHLIGFEEGSESATGINGIVSGDHINVKVDQGSKIATISFQPPPRVAGTSTLTLGNTKLTIQDGIVFDSVEEWSITEANLQLGDYLLGLTREGAISGYQFRPEANPAHALQTAGGETHVVSGLGLFAQTQSEQGDEYLPDFTLSVNLAQEGSLMLEFFGAHAYSPASGGASVNTLPLDFASVSVDNTPVNFTYSSDSYPPVLYIPGSFKAGTHTINLKVGQFATNYFNIPYAERRKLPQLIRLSVVAPLAYTKNV